MNRLIKAGLIFSIFGVLDFLMLLVFLLGARKGGPLITGWAAALAESILWIAMFWWVFLFTGAVLIVVGLIARPIGRGTNLTTGQPKSEKDRAVGAGIGLVVGCALGLAIGYIIPIIGGLGLPLEAAFGLIFGGVFAPKRKN